MLNKQGVGKIDWCDYTWNPVSGCLHDCSYCYVKRLNKRFGYDMTPAFHEKRLGDINGLQKPSRIFVCSTGDLFGNFIPSEWIEKVLDKCDEFPHHTYMFLTKNPNRYYEFSKKFTDNMMIGATTDTANHAGTFTDTLNIINTKAKRFISAEPLLEDIAEYLDYDSLDLIIIGADSNKGASKPPQEWAVNIVKKAWVERRNKCKIWVKDNYGFKDKIKEAF